MIIFTIREVKMMVINSSLILLMRLTILKMLGLMRDLD